MAASRLPSCLAVAAAVASLATASNRAYADASPRFSFFSSPAQPSSSGNNQADQTENAKISGEAEEPKGSGFDPEALERAAKALREINSSRHAKEVIFTFLLILVFCLVDEENEEERNYHLNFKLLIFKCKVKESVFSH